MKKHNFFWASLFLLAGLFLWSDAQAQQCYVLKDEASGFDVSPYQAALEAKACELIAAFDSTDYADSFRVFSFGFYLNLEYYDGYLCPVLKEIVYGKWIIRESNQGGKYNFFKPYILDEENITYSAWKPMAESFYENKKFDIVEFLKRSSTFWNIDVSGDRIIQKRNRV